MTVPFVSIAYKQPAEGNEAPDRFFLIGAKWRSQSFSDALAAPQFRSQNAEFPYFSNA
jgi:hypothetical protein